MKTQMNPPFSKLSFLQFHADDQADIDPAALPAAANELAGAAAILGAWPNPPGESDEGRQVFTEYAASLKSDTANLLNAVRTNQKGAAIRVFESLRKKCDSCHHFFRFDQSAGLEPTLLLAEARGG